MNKYEREHFDNLARRLEGRPSRKVEAAAVFKGAVNLLVFLAVSAAMFALSVAGIVWCVRVIF